jgi:hypothetical protein
MQRIKLCVGATLIPSSRLLWTQAGITPEAKGGNLQRKMS